MTPDITNAILSAFRFCITILPILYLAHGQNIFADRLDAPIVQVRKIKLSSLSSDTIVKSLPIKSISIDSSNGLWLISDNKIWRTNLLTQKLLRFELGQAESESFQNLTFVLGKIYAATSSMLYEIEPLSGGAKRFGNRSTINPKFSRVVSFADELLWLRSDELGFRKLAKDPIQFKKIPFQIGDKDSFLYDSKTDSWWLATGKLLLNLDRKGAEITGHPSPDQILTISESSESIFAFGKAHILAVNHRSKKQSLIDINPSLNLVCSAFWKDRQAYVFSSGLIEVYQLEPRRLLRYQLNPIPKNISECVFRKQIMALIAEGIPSVYQLFDSSL